MWKANLVAVITAFLGAWACCGPAFGSDANLIAHWSFDEGSGTTAYDSAGNNDGAIYGATWTTGQVGGALEFDGFDDYVSCGSGPAITGTVPFTVSAWVKRGIVGRGSIVAQRSASTNGMYQLHARADGRAQLQIYNGGYGCVVQSDAMVCDGLWHHVVGIRTNSTDGEIYVDGSLSGTDSGPARSLSNFPVLIGGWDFTSGHTWTGEIDEVMIFNRALSAEEVEQLYFGEGFSDLELAIMRIEDAVSEKEEMVDGIDQTLRDEQDAYDYLEEMLESKDYGDLKRRDIIKAKQEIHSAMQHQGQSADALDKSIEGLYDASDCLGWEPEPEPNEPEQPNEPDLVAHWSFDEGAGTTAYDTAGDNDGNIIGDPCWISGQIGSGLSFDGINDFVDVGDPPDGSLDFGTGDFTLSVWFKTLMTAPGFFVCKRAKGYYAGYDFYIESDGKVFARIADGGSVPDARTAAGFNDGLWHHAAAVYDRDGVIRVYIDGLSKATSMGISSIGSVNNGEPFTIGDRNDPGHHYYFKGSIDDVRIYDGALSSEGVYEIYVMGLPAHERAIMKLEEAVDEKEKMLQGIDDTLGDEQDAYEALGEMLESGDYGDLKKGDVVKARQRIHSAMQHQGQSADALDKSIEGLYDASDCLGWEPEPEPNEPEPNVPVPEPNFPVPTVGRGRSAAGK